VRRVFTVKDKLRILAATDQAAGTGDIGAILRREGVYSSTLCDWRRQREAGAFHALAPVKRGPKPVEANPLAAELALLQRTNADLTRRLARAETVIDVQKTGSDRWSACSGRNGPRYAWHGGERPKAFWWICPR
jgi:transposase-like protein